MKLNVYTSNTSVNEIIHFSDQDGNKYMCFRQWCGGDSVVLIKYDNQPLRHIETVFTTPTELYDLFGEQIVQTYDSTHTSGSNDIYLFFETYEPRFLEAKNKIAKYKANNLDNMYADFYMKHQRNRVEKQIPKKDI